MTGENQIADAATAADRYPVIYLAPKCDYCRDDGQMWCCDDAGPCEDCGAPWVKYVLALVQVESDQ